EVAAWHPPSVSRPAPLLEPPRSRPWRSDQTEEPRDALEGCWLPTFHTEVGLLRRGAAADFGQKLRRQLELRGLESGVVGGHQYSFAWVTHDARYGLAIPTGVWRITA